MSDTINIMVLPPAASADLPQILLEEDGVWRETVAAPLAKPPAKLRQETELYLSDIMDKVGGEPPVEVRASDFQFTNQFCKLSQNLLPEEVLKRLRAGHGPGNPRPRLHVSMRQGTEWIPWEMLHDGTQFLGISFQVARLPVVPQKLDFHGPRTCCVHRVHSLLGRGVLDPGALAEWEATFTPYATGPDWERRFPADGNDYPNLNVFGASKDTNVLHFTCH
jgi:hypothetical protein